MIVYVKNVMNIHNYISKLGTKLMIKIVFMRNYILRSSNFSVNISIFLFNSLIHSTNKPLILP